MTSLPYVVLQTMEILSLSRDGCVEVNTIVIFTPSLQGKFSVPAALYFSFVH